MGKATAYDESQRHKFLTATETRRRKAAAEIGDPDVIATLDHKLVKPTQPETPRDVFIPDARWD